MTPDGDRTPRRVFVADVARLASAAALGGCAARRGESVMPTGPAGAGGTWDLSWVDRLAGAVDRAVFDWPALGDPADPMVLQIAGRYLDGCDAVYGPGRHGARVVLNVRTQAVSAALTDAAWTQYPLGAEFKLTDAATRQPPTRNPFWHGVAAAVTGPTPPLPTLKTLVDRGAIVLVCDFALGHLARRLATRAGRDTDAVHRDLRDAFVPGAIAVPSGIFGLARAQNAGCAYIRM